MAGRAHSRNKQAASVLVITTSGRTEKITAPHDRYQRHFYGVPSLPTKLYCRGSTKPSMLVMATRLEAFHDKRN
jgi:hypothetical protein